MAPGRVHFTSFSMAVLATDAVLLIARQSCCKHMCVFVADVEKSLSRLGCLELFFERRKKKGGGLMFGEEFSC